MCPVLFDRSVRSMRRPKPDDSKKRPSSRCLPSNPLQGSVDSYRSPGDGKHRSHRFIAANAMVPAMLELEGWEEQVRLTEEWLQGKFEIPEIQDKWRDGPVVTLALETPEYAKPGEQMPIRLVMTANKVGHDFPTGPLDIIQSWVEIHVFDPEGNVVELRSRKTHS